MADPLNPDKKRATQEQEDVLRQVIEGGRSSLNPGELYKLQRQTDHQRRREAIDRLIMGGDSAALDEEQQPQIESQEEGNKPREPIAPIKSKPSQPKIPSQPQPVVPVGKQSVEEDKDVGWFDYVEWFASPILAVGDAALAPVAHEYESESTLGQAGEAFQVSWDALKSRLIPDINNLPEDYGHIIAERWAPDSSPLAKSSIAATLNVLSDPSTTLGIGALKTFQSGVRAMQVASVGNDGVWTLGLKDLLGVLNVSDTPAAQAARSASSIQDIIKSKVFKDKQFDIVRRRLMQAGVAAAAASTRAGKILDSLNIKSSPSIPEAQEALAKVARISEVMEGPGPEGMGIQAGSDRWINAVEESVRAWEEVVVPWIREHGKEAAVQELVIKNDNLSDFAKSLYDRTEFFRLPEDAIGQSVRQANQLSEGAQQQLQTLEEFGLTKEKGFNLSKVHETTMKGKEIISGGMDEDLTKYADEVARGDEFPPIAVHKRKDGLYEVIDGNHRLKSALKNDPEAEVRVLVVGEEAPRGSQAGKTIDATPESASRDARGPIRRFLDRRAEGKAAERSAKKRFDWKTSKDPQIRKMLALAEKADKGDKEALGRLNQLLESEFGTRMARAKMEDDARKVMPAIDEVMGHADEPLIRTVKDSPADVIPERMYERLTRKAIQLQQREAALQRKPRFQGPNLKPNVPLEEQPKLTIDRMRRAVTDLAKAKRKLPKKPGVQEERIFVKKLEETRDELRKAIDTYGADEVERVILRENPNLTDAQVKGLLDERVLDSSFVPSPRTTLRGVLEQHLADRHVASLSDNVLLKNSEVNYYKLNTLADVDELIRQSFDEYSKDIDQVFTPENLKKEVRITKGKTTDELFEESENLTDELIARMDPEAPIPEVAVVERTTKTVPMTDAEIDAFQQTQLEDLLGRKAVQRSGKESYVWRQILLDSSRRIKNLAKRVSSQVGKTDADEIALVKAIYAHKILTERAVGINPKASAEALHSLALSAETPAGRLAELKRLKPLVAESRRNNKIFSKLASASSDEAITKMVESMFRARPMDVLYEIFVNSILSGPGTHAINITSNAFVMMMQPTQKMFEAMSAAAFGRFAEAGQDLQIARVMLTSINETVMDWVHMAAKTGKSSLEMPEELARLHELYRVRHHPSVSAEAWNMTGRMGSIVDFIGKTVRLPGDALLKEDMAYKMMHYRMSVNEQALKMAKAKARNAKEFQQYYEMLRRNPLDSMSQTGVDFANYNTFTNSLGRMAQPVHSLRNSTPGVRWILPFYNTPTNIVKMGVRHSPLGNIYKDVLGVHMKEGGGIGMDFTAFKNTPEGDVARAKVALGTAITGSLTMLLGGEDENGIPRVTGHINTGTPMGRFMQSKGIPPYSVRIGSEWHSYEAIEPLKSVLGLMVTYRDAINNIDMEDQGAEELVMEAATTVAAPFIKVIGDNYLMPQISQLVWMIESMVAEPSPDSAPLSETYGARYFKRLGANILIPNFFNQLKLRGGFMEGTPGEGLYDPVFRQAETALQHIQNRIPGLSSYLPAYVDIWGDERHMPQALGPDIVSPINIHKENKDAIDLIIMDLGRKKLLSLPGMKKEIKGVRMDIWEREQYAKLVGKGDPSLGIPPLKEEIKAILTDPMVKNLPDEGKAEIIKQHINQRRTAMDGLFIQKNKEFRERFIRSKEQEQLKFQSQQKVQVQ